MIKPISIANLTDPIAGLPADCVDRTVRSVISKFFILAGQLAVIDQDDVIIRIDLFNLIQLTDSDPLNGVVEMMLQLSGVPFCLTGSVLTGHKNTLPLSFLTGFQTFRHAHGQKDHFLV